MNPVLTKLLLCYENIRKLTDFQPILGLVLGSGLGTFADTIKIETFVNYRDIEGFPVSTVSGHKGRFVFGYLQDYPIVIMQGRVHFYEGYSMQDVVLPIRLMKLFGARYLILTNAAGGIHDSLKPGDFLLLRDHISSFIPSPLIGPNLDELGTRFPDMSNVYDNDVSDSIKAAAMELRIPLKEGVYIQLTGPSFETPAEITMCKRLGADAVGMSTVCEAIAAHHMGMKVAGISMISNVACKVGGPALSLEEVKETAVLVEESFHKLIANSIIKICSNIK